MVAEAALPPGENRADSPLLFRMVAVRENVSTSSTSRSLLMVMEQAGVEEFPGPLPEGKVTGHVIPMKSPPAPTVVRSVGNVITHIVLFQSV